MANAKRVLKAPSQTPMVVPSHGRGLIRVGGTNKGGTGRPKDVIRAACLLAFDQRIQVLQGLADNPDTDDMVRIRAIDTLGKYGMGPAHEVTIGADQSSPLRIIHEHVQVPMRNSASAASATAGSGGQT